MDRQVVVLELFETGLIEVRAASTDQAPPVFSELAQVAAEEIGVPRELVVPPSGGVAADEVADRTKRSERITRLAGGAVAEAARCLKGSLIEVAAELLNRSPAEVAFSDGWAVAADDDDSPLLSMADLAAAMLATKRPVLYESSFGGRGRRRSGLAASAGTSELRYSA